MLKEDELYYNNLKLPKDMADIVMIVDYYVTILQELLKVEL